MVEYPDFIIGDPYSDNKFVTNNISKRNLLSVKIGESKDKILCVMMNPSKADTQQSDRTVNKVLNLLENTNAGIIEIVNLFPIYKTNSNELYTSLQEVINVIGFDGFDRLIAENDKLIRRKIVHADLIIFAWGDTPENMPCILHMKQCMKILSVASTIESEKFCIFKTKRWEKYLTKLGNPRHPNRNKITDLISCTVDKFGIIHVSDN